MRSSLRLLASSLTVTALNIGVAAAESPACTAGSSGTLACFVGRSCECRYHPGGTMTGEPAGYRWDCSELQPSCPDTASPPATLPPVWSWVPDGVEVELPGRAPHPPHPGPPRH